jgi:hypothetical protein
LNWSVLQIHQELGAPLALWMRELGPDFEPFKLLCLATDNEPAQIFHCPVGRGRFHFILPYDTGFHCFCNGERPLCPDIPLSPDGVILFSLNPAKLGLAIAHALGLNPKWEQLLLPNTYLIGSWSADAVPVILTLPWEPQGLHHAVAELGVRLQRPFILLAPTSRLLTERCRELLILARAGFFSLESTLVLTSGGTLTPMQPPGILLAAFTPQPTDGQDDVARKLFALAKALDSDPTFKKALPSSVLRLYCLEEFSPSKIARRLHCGRTLIFRRLRLLRQKLGRTLAELRALSSHFQKIEDSLTDSRARRINRSGAISGQEDPPDS